MKPPIEYSLRTQDWSACIDGEHLTGTIRYNDENDEYRDVELERTVGLKEVKYLAEKDGSDLWLNPRCRSTNRFTSEEQLEKAAIKVCRKLAAGKEHWVLIHDNLHNPNMPVDGEGPITKNFKEMKIIAEKWGSVPVGLRDEELKKWHSLTFNERT